jgi:hypothetical protein
MRLESRWYDLAAEICDVRGLQKLQQDLPRKHVDSHRRDERLLSVVCLVVKGASRRHAAAQGGQSLAGGLLFESSDVPLSIEEEESHPGRVNTRDGQRRYRDVGVLVNVRIEEAAIVHPVEVVPGENEVVVRLMAGEMPGRLTYRIGGALKPIRIVRRLLGRNDVDEAARKRIHLITLSDMVVQRCRVELGQDEDAPQIGVQAVADGHVDETVLSADRHRRFRALLG